MLQFCRNRVKIEQNCRTLPLMVIRIKKKLYGPILWMWFNCLKARATSIGSLLFTTEFPETPGTHFIDLRRMKG